MKRGVTGEAVAELKSTEGASRRLAGAALAAAALMLAACTASAPPVETPASLPPPAIKPAEAEISQAALREHQRILSAYGGVYNDPRLQGMLEQTVDRLVAASEPTTNPACSIVPSSESTAAQTTATSRSWAASRSNSIQPSVSIAISADMANTNSPKLSLRKGPAS